MKKKQNEISIEEITKNEISIVDMNDKLEKLQKDRIKDKKIISEYKEREKATARALILYERKIKWLKETIINDLLKISTNIGEDKKQFDELCQKFLNFEMKDQFKELLNELTCFQDDIYNICNKIDMNAVITKSDRDYISNRKQPTKNEDKKLDINSRFEKLKQEFDQKIGDSVNRKPGRPKKQDQSILSDIGLRSKPEKEVEVNENIENKLDSIFYEAPQNKKVVSSIPQTSDSIFDFNEALNPNISLKDIMNDLMSENDNTKADKSEIERTEKIKVAQQKSQTELLEAGYIRKPMITRKTQSTQPQKTAKLSFEERFMSLQGLINKNKQ